MFFGNNSSITVKKVTKLISKCKLTCKKITDLKNREIIAHFQTVITFEPEVSIINSQYSKLSAESCLSISFYSLTSHTDRNVSYHTDRNVVVFTKNLA